MDLAELAAAIERNQAANAGALAQLAKDMKALDGRAEDIEKRMGRMRLGTGGGGGGPGAIEGDDVVAMRKAIGVFARTGEDREIKTLAVGSDPDGGYVVHPALSTGMTKKLFDASPIRQLARVETITIGDAWEEPIDKDDVGASWVGEQEDRPATATPQLGMLRVPVHETYALQPVTQRLLDDSAIDIGGWLEGKVTDKFGRQEGAAFLTGTGVKQPKGLLASTIVSTGDSTRAWGQLQYIPSGAATTITADALKDLVYAVRAPYRKGSTWVMASTTAAAIDKLKDGNGAYLWRDAMTAGAPPSLLGYPVEFEENMPTIGAASYPIAFGNWKMGYLVVDKPGIRFLRDPFSDKPRVMFYWYRRVGGGVANSEAIKVMQVGTS